MIDIKYVFAAGLLFGAPGAALAQEEVPESCDPQTVAQWLGIEDIPGCGDEGGDDGADGEESADAQGPRQGLLQAHESSGGRSTEALEHANTMSGGSVLSAFTRSRASEEADEEERGNRGRGRP